ncbi:MAG: iron complex transport system ATP-binding protein [Bradymonadia bacterium]|jgi:iron complex transport system ATP-binding protein
MSVQVKVATVQHGGKPALNRVSITFEPGSLTAIIGPNGAGKSTLLRACAGLLPLSDGSVTLAGRCLAEIRPADVAKLISMMSQRIESPQLSVLDVILLGRSAYLGRFGQAGKTDREAAIEAAAEVGVAGLADREFPSLSGGERQRVLFAMQTLQAAPVALFDEPNSAQDFDGTRLMLGVLRRRTANGDCVIAAVHDLNLALRGFDRVICLADGEVVADGEPEATVASTEVNAAFSGALRIEQAENGIVVLPRI